MSAIVLCAVALLLAAGLVRLEAAWRARKLAHTPQIGHLPRPPATFIDSGRVLSAAEFAEQTRRLSCAQFRRAVASARTRRRMGLRRRAWP